MWQRAIGRKLARQATYGESRELRRDRRLLDILSVRHAREHGGRDGSSNSVELHDCAISPAVLGEEEEWWEVVREEAWDQ